MIQTDRYFNFFIYITLLLGTSIQSQSQTTNKNHLEVFDSYFENKNKEINNGRIYEVRYRSIKNTHAFFKDRVFLEASILYNKQTYNTKLQYDIVNDLIIVRYINLSNPFKLSLSPELIEQIQIENQYFVKLPKTIQNQSYYKNGLFEKVFVGSSIEFFIKHFKEKHLVLENKRHEFFFKKKNLFIVKYKNHFYNIKTKKNLIKAMPPFEKEIKSYFKKKKGVNRESLLELFEELDKKSNQ